MTVPARESQLPGGPWRLFARDPAPYLLSLGGPEQTRGSIVPMARAIFAAAALLASVAPALAAEAAPIAANVVVARGFKASAPRVAHDADGSIVRGAICRTAVFAMTPKTVRIERVSQNGAVEATTDAVLTGALGHRSRGCGYYVAHTGWQMGADETLRIRFLQQP